jgi:type II secretory pathway component PulF
VQSLVGKEGTISVKEAGIFARSGKHIVLSVVAGVMTFCLYYLVTTLNGAEVDLQGSRAGSKEMLYRIADALGPTGTIIVGGLITALLIFKAYKNSKLSYQITVYVF